jgi:hypothetical protein
MHIITGGQQTGVGFLWTRFWTFDFAKEQQLQGLKAFSKEIHNIQVYYYYYYYYYYFLFIIIIIITYIDGNWLNFWWGRVTNPPK